MPFWKGEWLRVGVADLVVRARKVIKSARAE